MPLRPFTPEELQDLVSKGYDMTSYKGEALEFPDAPAAATSATAAGARAAAASALPTAAGGAGFAGGMYLGGALAPATGGLSLAIPFITGAIGAYGASKIAGKAQEAILPESALQQLAIDAQEHPTAATIGQLSTIPLGGLQPSRLSLLSSLSGASKLGMGLGTGALKQVEKQALINSSAGAAIGGVQEAVMQPIEGREFNLNDILLNTAIGATASDANRIGKHYGFHGLQELKVNRPSLLREWQSKGQVVAPEVKEEVVVRIPKKEKELTVEQEELQKELNEALGQKEQQREKLGTPLQQQVEAGLKQDKLNPNLSPELLETYGKEVAEPNAIKQIFDPDLMAQDESGFRTIKGRANLGEGTTEISPEATIDTPHHERVHHWLTELEQKAASGDKESIKSLEQLVNLSRPGYEAFRAERKAANLREQDLHEFITSEQGLEFVKQQFNLDNEGKWKKWWNDTKSLLKEKYSEPAIEEKRRAVNFRTVNETKPLSKLQTGSRNQDENPRGWEEGHPRDWEAYWIDSSGNPIKVNDHHEYAKSLLGDNYDQDKGYSQMYDKGYARLVRDKDTGDFFIDNGRNFRPTQKHIKAAKDLAIENNATLYDAKGFRTIWSPSDKFQESNKGLSRDVSRYEELVNIMKTNPTTEAWQELEAIKNKNGGKPPVEREQGGEEGLTNEQEKLLRLRKKGEGITPNTFTKEDYNKLPNALSEIDKKGEELDAALDLKEEGSGLVKEDIENINKLDRQAGILLDVDNKNNSRNQESGEGLQDTTKQGFLRPLESTFDKVGRVDTELKTAFQRWQARREQFIGLRNASLKDLDNYSREDIEKVTGKMREAYRNDKESIEVKGKEAEIRDILSGYYSKIADIRRDSGLRIDDRKAGKNPMYVPDQLSDNTLDLLVNKSQTVEARHAINQWVDYTVKESKGAITEKEARQNIAAYIRALGGEKHNYLAAEFGAIRKAAGYGLPESIRELDGQKSLAKYGQRAANDLAMYTELESKPDVASKLLLKDPNTSKYHPGTDETNPIPQATEIRDAMKWVTGGFSGTISKSAPKVNAFVRLVNNSLLGTATGLRNVVQMPVNAVPYVHQFSDLGAFWNGLLKTRENSRASLESGATQPQIDKLQFDELLEAPDRFTAIVRKAATVMRKWQGAEAIENLSRDITFSVGKELARHNIAGAKAGNKKSQQWLEKFGLLVDEDITKLTGNRLENALNQVGKNFTDRNQGTYGGSGLPVGIVDSQFAPFFALQKWSVEKSNVIYKDVVKPFLTGENRLPLLTYTLGTVLTGAAIQKLNELLTNRKGQDPTWKESLDKGTANSIVSELATLMQLASFGGIVGDSLKFASDIGLHGKTPRNIVSFPSATAALNFEEKTRDMVEAIQQGENPWDVFKNYALDLLTAQVQGARLLANNTIKEGDVERSDKFRDVRIFNELEGKPSGNITAANPYLGIPQRAYKREADIGKAVSDIPTLIGDMQKKSAGDIEKLKKQFQSLKGNSYQTFPSPSESPQSFQTYYEFLKRTQGQEVADARLKDYLRQSNVNKIKSSLVPGL